MFGYLLSLDPPPSTKRAPFPRPTAAFPRVMAFCTNYCYRHRSAVPSSHNEENSQTFDRCVSPLVGAAAHKSNFWVLSDKGKEESKINCKSFGFRAYIKQS
jgi:hypothetical protein